MKQFVYCRDTEGGMEIEFLNMTQVSNWVETMLVHGEPSYYFKKLPPAEQERVREVDREMLEWAEKAEVGEVHRHRMGLLIRLKDGETAQG